MGNNENKVKKVTILIFIILIILDDTEIGRKS